MKCVNKTSIADTNGCHSKVRSYSRQQTST